MASVGSMGISVDDSFFYISDADNDYIEMDSDAESAAPSIERPIEIKNIVDRKYFILSCMLLFHFILMYVFFYFLFLILIIDSPANNSFDANEFPLLILSAAHQCIWITQHRKFSNFMGTEV